MATMAGSDTNMTPVTEQSPPLQLTKSAEKLTPRPSRPHAPRRSSTMNGPLYMQSSDKKVNRSRVRRKDDGPLKNMTAWLFENQTGMSLSSSSSIVRLRLILRFFPLNRCIFQPRLSPLPHPRLHGGSAATHLQVLQTIVLQPTNGEIWRRS
ncbi:MAG: very-long-chain ceramide synthase [Mucilaginibacter sp.]|nr:very-long-chain ceramide synthase [Mucilaginibacter sp.]